MTRVIIPATVTNIGQGAVTDCTNLADVYFLGDAPAADSTVFQGDPHAPAYYLPNTTGWSEFSTNTGLPAVLWNPVIQADVTYFGIRINQFGFNITGTSNIPVVIEACANLANPNWIPLQTNTIANGSIYFSDPQWMNCASRNYRITAP